VREDDGLDEMERLRKAMEKEKAKAKRFNDANLSKRIENKTTGPSTNPLQLQKNLDGFVKSQGLVVGEKIDHQAVNQ